jgi:hypothetical protein
MTGILAILSVTCGMCLFCAVGAWICERGEKNDAVSNR